MQTLEQAVGELSFRHIKNHVRRLRNSVISKVAVYSLAGILGAGLGYGCEGNECGNGECESTYENCNSCPDDCGNCSPNQSNNDRSTNYMCPVEG